MRYALFLSRGEEQRRDVYERTIDALCVRFLSFVRSFVRYSFSSFNYYRFASEVSFVSSRKHVIAFLFLVVFRVLLYYICARSCVVARAYDFLVLFISCEFGVFFNNEYDCFVLFRNEFSAFDSNRARDNEAR